MEREEIYEISFSAVREYAGSHNPQLQLLAEVGSQLPYFKKRIQLLRWPSVSIEAFAGEGYADPYFEGESNYGVRLSLSKPLYDSGVNKRKIEKMNLEIAAFEASVVAEKKDFYAKLELLYRKFVHAREEILGYREQLDLAKNLAALSGRSYELGISSYSDMIKNRDMEQENEVEYLAASNRYLSYEFALKIAAGVTNLDYLTHPGPAWLSLPPVGAKQE